MSEEILPCPFCGSEARFVPETPEGDCQAFCVICDLGFEARSIMAEDAIANWNTRSLPAAIDTVVAEVERRHGPHPVQLKWHTFHRILCQLRDEQRTEASSEAPARETEP